MHKYLLFLFLATYCYGSDLSNSIEFCTTRSLEDGALKKPLLEKLTRVFNTPVFIETGTCLGNTTAQAAEVFQSVYTIELSLDLYLKACQRFKNCETVEVYCGDSAVLLNYILPEIEERILFYLDGHYSGPSTACGSLSTPILKELEAIERGKKTDAIILIDDLRLFQPSCFPEKVCALNIGLENYPDLSELVEAILKINPLYQICFLGDALLAFPADESVNLSPVVQACALHRLEPYFSTLCEEELQVADQIIGQAQGNEKAELECYYRTYAEFELSYGYRSYGCFWYGLILMNQGYASGAQALFSRAAQNSPPNWRVIRYTTH